jgi:hypothetical protein
MMIFLFGDSGNTYHSIQNSDMPASFFIDLFDEGYCASTAKKEWFHFSVSVSSHEYVGRDAFLKIFMRQTIFSHKKTFPGTAE